MVISRMHPHLLLSPSNKISPGEDRSRFVARAIGLRVSRKETRIGVRMKDDLSPEDTFVEEKIEKGL